MAAPSTACPRGGSLHPTFAIFAFFVAENVLRSPKKLFRKAPGVDKSMEDMLSYFTPFMEKTYDYEWQIANDGIAEACSGIGNDTAYDCTQFYTLHFTL